MSQSEDLEQQRPLLPKPTSISFSNRPPGRVSGVLESDKCHKFVIFLIAVDASCILADLTYTFLSEECIPAEGPEAPHWLLILALISLSITTLFLIEIPLALYAFGIRYYLPFGGYPLAGLHLFDALVIVTTFIFEFALKGRERQLAGLLIMLRLWRLVKLVGGIAVGAGELREETERQLAATAAELERCKSALSAREGIEQQLAATTAELEQCKSTLSSTRETTGQQLAATVAELEQCKSAVLCPRRERAIAEWALPTARWPHRSRR